MLLSLAIGCEAPEPGSDTTPEASPADSPALLVRRIDPEDPTRVELHARGLPLAALDAWRGRPEDDPAWSRLLAVYLEDTGLGDSLPSLLGTWTIEAGQVVFRPRFPLMPGRTYRAVLRPAALAGTSASAGIVEDRIQIPERDAGPPTEVAAVYPSARTVPENLLRLYVHFSAPMSQGDAYEHLRLLDIDAGQEVRDPWMAAEELWDATGERLTLLIHPGRIKRGLMPREVEGPVLEEGRTYVLQIEADWLDATGRPLGQEHDQFFHAGPADRRQPDPADWTLLPPLAGSRLPVTLELPEPLDRALARRLIWIVDASGEPVAGEVELSREETVWTFRPAVPWQAGGYHVRVGDDLEDLAGNSIRAPFDVDVFERSEHPVVETTELAFEVRE